jgi:hypothetical protein
MSSGWSVCTVAEEHDQLSELNEQVAVVIDALIDLLSEPVWGLVTDDTAEL